MKTTLTKNYILFLSLFSVSVFNIACGDSEHQTEQSQFTSSLLSRFYMWPIPLQEIPDGLSSLHASECGECHTQIYEDWKRSIHAKAFVDLQFQAEWKKDNYLPLCINCHIPLENQQEFIVTGFKDNDFHQPLQEKNPDFDAILQQEGLTCAACHVRDGTIIGPYGNPEAPHPVKKDEALMSAQTCITCHNTQDALSPTLICNFTTGDEWQVGPYSKQGKDCITCHMPEENMPLIEDTPPRKAHRHFWVGNGIPKFFDEGDTLLHFQSGLEIRISKSKAQYMPGDTAHLIVAYGNQYAGHQIPTGDVELFITIDLVLEDGNGITLKKYQERIGEVWEWWPEAKKISDNSLKPLEWRELLFDYLIPNTVSKIHFKVIVTNHRMTEENARYMGLLGIYPLSTQVLSKTIILTGNER